jgi:hypothetical protein
MHNDVLDAFNHHQTMPPHPDDIAGCESFAPGYATAAALDPFLDRRRRPLDFCFLPRLPRRSARSGLDLVPKQTLAKFEEVPEAKIMLRRDLGGVVAAAHDTFLNFRRDALAGSAPIDNVRARRVGRNEPYPCGSGQKFEPVRRASPVSGCCRLDAAFQLTSPDGGRKAAEAVPKALFTAARARFARE